MIRGRWPAFLLVVFLLTSVTSLIPESSSAQELLSWWKRDLVPLDLEPGSWVVYASEEHTEGQVFVDTLSVQVLETDSLGRRWVELVDVGSPESDLLLIDPALLSPERPMLDALVRHVRRLPGDRLIEEDVEEHRRSRLVQRHFGDPFHDPAITRTDLPDTLVLGEGLRRERVVLREVREEPRPVGGGVLVTSLYSEAELCSSVPVFGVLRGRSVTDVFTRAGGESENRHRRRMPPLRNEFRWTCLDFGRERASGLPVGLGR